MSCAGGLRVSQCQVLRYLQSLSGGCPERSQDHLSGHPFGDELRLTASLVIQVNDVWLVIASGCSSPAINMFPGTPVETQSQSQTKQCKGCCFKGKVWVHPQSMQSVRSSASILTALRAQALDVCIDLGPKGVEACLREAGVGFMYAPRYHPAMKAVRSVRGALKVRLSQKGSGPEGVHTVMGKIWVLISEERQGVGEVARSTWLQGWWQGGGRWWQVL